MRIHTINTSVKKTTLRILSPSPSVIRSNLKNAPMILVRNPPINDAIISLTSGELLSLTGILKIGLNKLVIKSFTEKRLKKKRTNSCASLTIVTRAYE